MPLRFPSASFSTGPPCAKGKTGQAVNHLLTPLTASVTKQVRLRLILKAEVRNFKSRAEPRKNVYNHADGFDRIHPWSIQKLFAPQLRDWGLYIFERQRARRFAVNVRKSVIPTQLRSDQHLPGSLHQLGITCKSGYSPAHELR